VCVDALKAGTPRTPRQATPRGYISHHHDVNVGEASRIDSILSKSPAKPRLPGKENADIDAHARLESASQASGEATEAHSISGDSHIEIFHRKGDTYENARRSVQIDKGSSQAHSSVLHAPGGMQHSPGGAGEASSRRNSTVSSRLDVPSDPVNTETQTETYRSVSVRRSHAASQTLAVVKDEASIATPIRQNKDEFVSLNTKVEFLHRLLQGDKTPPPRVHIMPLGTRSV
jgi:hypothetical protein